MKAVPPIIVSNGFLVPPNEVGWIAQYVRKEEGRKEENDRVENLSYKINLQQSRKRNAIHEETFIKKRRKENPTLGNLEQSFIKKIMNSQFIDQLINRLASIDLLDKFVKTKKKTN